MGMAYLTTLDVFCVAVAKGLLTDTQVKNSSPKLRTIRKVISAVNQ
jgi:hypothetical protein